jgi:MoaF-like
VASQTSSPFRAGQVLEIPFPTFTPRITVLSERELTVQILRVTTWVSPTLWIMRQSPFGSLVVLSWREHIGSTVVHVLDFVSGNAYTAVTPAKGEFMRLTGRIEITPAT